MVITLNIQGASPEEIRETCKQFAEMGINNRIVVKGEDLVKDQVQAPTPEHLGGGNHSQGTPSRQGPTPSLEG